jgi:hypothetical protein
MIQTVIKTRPRYRGIAIYSYSCMKAVHLLYRKYHCESTRGSRQNQSAYFKKQVKLFTQRYDMHKITQSYREPFSVCPNITSKFRTIAIFDKLDRQSNGASRQSGLCAGPRGGGQSVWGPSLELCKLKNRIKCKAGSL